MSLSAGMRLGPYQIVDAVGAGGMGEVYRATDERLGREVAIKILPAALRDPNAFARFEREARTCSALNHPNIVTVHELARSGEIPYIAMELVRGEPLRNLMKRRVPVRRALAIGAQVADALAAAHDAGIVHRDLKPENVMVTPEGRAKVLDFGIARRDGGENLTGAATDVALTSEGAAIGTAAYMSPEQAKGERVDFRSDQFALGVILWEMMAGRHPFARKGGIATMTAIVHEEEEDLERVAGVPAAVAEIVARCLRKEPAERYGSTADLAYDLRRATEAPKRAVRRSPRLVAAFAAVALAALLAGYLGARLTRPEPPRAGVPMQVAVATPEISVRYGETVAPMALSPDGRMLVIDGNGPDEQSRLWLHDLTRGSTRPIDGTAGGYSPAWSSDGRAIAFFADGKLKTVALDGSPPRVIADASPEGGPAWHGDTIVFAQFAGGGPSVWKVSVNGGEPVRVVAPRARRVPFWPEFLPDGRRFLFLDIVRSETDGSRYHELMAGSIDGGEPRRVAAINSRAVFVEPSHLLYVRDGALLAHPFDPDELRFTGDPVPLAGDVYHFFSTGLSAFTPSRQGAVAWRTPRRATELAWVDRGGGVERVIGREIFDEGRISADGRTYATSVVDAKLGIADIWMWDLERGSGVRATFDRFDVKAPLPMPDGSMLYRTDAAGPPDIHLLRAGEQRGTPFYTIAGVQTPLDVSPDGKFVLVGDHNRTTGGDLWVVPFDDPKSARPFVATPTHEWSPRFSPDGEWVAYESDASGRLEVYVRPFEGASAPVRVSSEGGSEPRWAADGDELFYLSPGGGITSVSVTRPARAIRLGAPQVLFRVPRALDFEVAPEGDRFLIRSSIPSTAPEIRLLTDWRAAVD